MWISLSRSLLLVLCVVGVQSCHPRQPVPASQEPVTLDPSAPEWSADEELQGLRVVLSDGAPSSGGASSSTVAATEVLPPSETAALLDRLPALETVEGVSFALRESSLPPPKTGEVVAVPFPGDSESAGPPETAPKALEVVRFAPEGDVALAPHLSVTFNQPMVALSSQAIVAETVPVTLSPEIPGEWVWLGTRTLQFKPEGRFPMATEFRAEVAAGVTSEAGQRLEAPATFSFRTPALEVTGKYPSGGPQVQRPAVFLGFNQRVSPQELSEYILLKVGSSPVPFTVLTSPELEGFERVQALADKAQPERMLVVQPVEELPKGTNVAVVLKRGAPSAEGPRVTEKDKFAFSFQVHEALKVNDVYCRWRRSKDCSPEDNWSFEFNNPLDPERFDPKSVTIDPPMDNPAIHVSGRYLNIGGMKKGRTKYTVTVPASITDRFAQELGKGTTHSFEVGPARPFIQGPRGEMLVLDPSGARTLAIYTRNRKKVRLVIHAVQPEDRAKLSDMLSNWRYQDRGKSGELRKNLPGTELFHGPLMIEDQPDEMVETAIDLTPYLNQGTGQLLVWVEDFKAPPSGPWDRNLISAWVQSTQLAVSSQSDGQQLQVWASSLADGTPLEGAEVELFPHGLKATVDARGFAELPLPEKTEKSQLLLVRHKGDLALQPKGSTGLMSYYGSNVWKKSRIYDSKHWFVFDDRGLYKPGETARIKGWVRTLERSPKGELRGPGGAVDTLTWVAKDNRGNEIAKGKASVSALGGFDFAVALPKTVNLGQGFVVISMPGFGNHRKSLNIQEFRRPEYEVGVSAGKGPHLLGDRMTLKVNAAYFSGGGLAGAPTSWSLRSSPGSFTPPNRDTYTFGTWRPWWRSWHSNHNTGSYLGRQEGETDALGNHYLEVHFEAMNPPKPVNVIASASVTDVNRQRWTGSTTTLVHPSSLYVGLKMEKSVVAAKKPFEVELIAVDLDGKAVSGTSIDTTLHRLEWKRVKGNWTEVGEVMDTCVRTSGTEPVTCKFTPPSGASYRVETRVKDAFGRPNASSRRLWVPGGKQRPVRKVELENVMLIPDRKDVQPGETLTVLVQSPFTPAQGLMTLRRNGLLETRPFVMTEASHTLEIPILDSQIPGFTVQVDLIGSAPRTDDAGEPVKAPPRPAYATGSLAIQVPPRSRTLQVEVTPQDRALMPGSKTALDLRVTNAAGEAVANAELAVVVVDESVLSLTGYKMADPLSIFYPMPGAGVHDARFRRMVQLTDPLVLEAQAEMEEAEEDSFGAEEPSEMRGMMDSAPPPAAKPMKAKSSKRKAEAKPNQKPSGSAIKVRTNFNALALFAPDVRTDASGQATVKVTLPDNLTRYRVMVVAVAGEKQFGKGESSITARLPLMLRPSPPRFLNFGDAFELPLVIQNQTDEEAEVLLAARGGNIGFAQSIGEATPGVAGQPQTGRRVRVAPNDRIEVRLPAATVKAGKAVFQVAFSSGEFADAARFELPVWTPATSEGFATYGVVDEGVDVQSLIPPEEVWPQFGGLEVSTSSTQLQALTDAVVYLSTYPYECNEQRASRVLAIAALNEVLSEFEAEGLPSPEALRAGTVADLQALSRRQNHNGGWAFWRKGDASWPYLTVHITHALVRARAMDFAVSDQTMNRALQYLKNIEKHIPKWYSQRSRDAIIAQSIMVRTLAGDADTAKALKLARKGPDALSLEALGWILPTLQQGRKRTEVAQITRYLVNRVSETAGNAHFVTQYEDGAHVLLHSSRRADGVLLDALIQVSPKSDLIPKLVRGLLAHRVRGRWSSTQENAFVLLAMDRYFKKYEGVSPDFVARVWLGDGFAGEHAFRGRSTETAKIQVPMSYVAALPGKTNVVVQKDGPGRLYYRMGLNYAPKDLSLKPMDRGFTVLRTYESVDDPDDVSRAEDGTWHVKAGASVRVRVQMVAPGRRYHVALVDPLAAGLEVLNPALAVTGELPEDPKAKGKSPYWWWSRPWYQYQNLRDERVEAFSTLVWSGVHEYTYVARATTPGRFVIPPAKAEEMYSPETFGRSGTDSMVVYSSSE